MVILEHFVLQHRFAFTRRHLCFDTGVQNEPKKIWFFWNVGTIVTVIHDHPQFLHVRVEDPRMAHPIYLTPSIPHVMLLPRGTYRQDFITFSSPWKIFGKLGKTLMLLYMIVECIGQCIGQSTHD